MLKEISIEILRKCPNCCVHCSSLSDINCREILALDQFIDIVDDAHELGAITICLSGGEPFLHPQIVEMIDYIASKGLACYVYSSGVMLNEEQVPSSIHEGMLAAIAGKVTKIIFNIEAATEATYNRIMGTTGCLALMKESVLRANALTITTEAHFVPMKINIHELDQVVSLCRTLGLSKLSFLRLVPHGRAQVNQAALSLSDSELAELIKKLNSLQEQESLAIRIGVPLSDGSACHICEAANGKINIKYDGSVYPCEVFKNDCVGVQLNGFTPDNIFEQSFRDIYTNSNYLQFVRDCTKAYGCDKHGEACLGQYLIRERGLSWQIKIPN